MKKTTVVLTAILLLGLLFSNMVMAKGGNGNKKNLASQLTAQETKDLIQLREEEKLARDVYLFLYEQWGQWLFSNIAESEQQHMDAVYNLLNKYGIPDPVEIDEPGVFRNTDLQHLYDELTVVGSVSEIEALWVGATIEDLDIYDIQKMLENTTKNDLINVYQNLMKGSRNHLRSFGGQLETFGVIYEAQYLLQEEVDAIINSPKERGKF